MKKSAFDIATVLINKTIDTLFIYHPKRTSLGVLLGSLLYSIKVILMPFLNTISIFDFKSLHFYYFFPIGIFLMHIPTIFHNFLQHSEIPEEIQKAMQLIKNYEKDTGDTEAANKMRFNLIEKIIISLEQNEFKASSYNKKGRGFA